MCTTVDFRLTSDNAIKIAKNQIPHRINHLFFDFNLLRYRATKTITIHTRTARESVAAIHIIRTIRARIERTEFSFFLILFVKNRRTNGRNATKKYQ